MFNIRTRTIKIKFNNRPTLYLINRLFWFSLDGEIV